MKALIAPMAAVAMTLPAYAQQDSLRDVRAQNETPLVEEVFKLEKKSDKFNLYLNMHAEFDALWRGNDFDEGKFRFQQLRIEAKGKINDWLSYRYRQRLNKGDSPDGYRDNLLNSIDIAGVGLNCGKWNFFLGKQCAAYGGIEFDLNPIEVYQYCDMIDYMSNFMTGVNIAYNFTPDQQLQFQVLNSLNGKSEEMYGDYTRAKLPLLYTLNWNGSFAGGFYKTRWSASFMNETKNAHTWYFAAGNEFNFSPKWGAYLDWMYAREGVDRLGIITDIVAPDGWTRKAAKTDIMSLVLHVNYRFHPAWNIFAKAMYENEGVYKTNLESIPDGSGKDVNREVRKGKYRTALGYIGGIEYYPFKDRNLHFFAAYIGRDYKYTAKAKAFGQTDYATNALQVGFIWQMPVF